MGRLCELGMWMTLGFVLECGFCALSANVASLVLLVICGLIFPSSNVALLVLGLRGLGQCSYVDSFVVCFLCRTLAVLVLGWPSLDSLQ